MSRTAQFNCLDCGIDTSKANEYYMVWDQIWMHAMGEDVDKMVCIGCLEDRLGFILTPDDFTDVPVNQGVFGMSDRMKDRLGLDTSPEVV